MIWNPVQARSGISLSAVDIAAIQSGGMAGQAKDDASHYPADAVFQGGGIFGIAFLGALRCCDDLGITWISLAGTSAGSITAGLLAADYTIDELETVFAAKNYMDFLGETTYFSLFPDRDPGDDLSDGTELIQLITSLMLHGQMGRYKTDLFHDWYAGLLQAKGVTGFGQVFKKIGGRTRQLRFVTSDLSNQRMRVLPDDYPKPYGNDRIDIDNPSLDPARGNLEVAQAARCSMSIPLFFEPAKIDEAVIVDGGLLSNFPLRIFDSPPGVKPQWPTFGFRLIDRTPPKPPVGIGTLVPAIIHTMMGAADTYYVDNHAEDRIIEIDVTEISDEGISATSFNAGADVLERLYSEGYQAAKDFFKDRWNWAGHLARR